MHYITIGILIGVGIMLAPMVVEVIIILIRAIPVILVGVIALAVVGAAIYGLVWVIAENAGDIGFWILVAFSTFASFALFWPRSNSDGKSFLRARGLIAGSLIILVGGFGILMAGILLAVIVMYNWREPSFWLGSTVFLAISTFVIVTVRRGRLEEQRQHFDKFSASEVKLNGRFDEPE